MKTLLDSIAPAQALGIEVASWDGSRITLSAPLEPSLNDKGTAFAGSIDALLDLSGWSAIMLALRDAGTEADVMIVKSETAYLSAVTANMTAEARIPDNERERILQELSAAGRSRIALTCQLVAEGNACATMTAHYAIIKRGST